MQCAHRLVIFVASRTDTVAVVRVMSAMQCVDGCRPACRGKLTAGQEVAQWVANLLVTCKVAWCRRPLWAPHATMRRGMAQPCLLRSPQTGRVGRSPGRCTIGRRSGGTGSAKRPPPRHCRYVPCPEERCAFRRAGRARSTLHVGSDSKLQSGARATCADMSKRCSQEGARAHAPRRTRFA